MSADNYYMIRKHPNGKFVAVMGFASDSREPVVTADESYKLFDDPVSALLWAHQQPSEYGASVHPECGNLKISKSDYP